MGGQAFSNGENPLYTPRMPPAVYRHLRDRYHALLRDLFVVVATPIEAPAKESFGDIDIFVTWPRHELFPSSEAMAAVEATSNDLRKAAGLVLGAERSKPAAGMATMLAVPWPKDLPEGLDQADDDEARKARFVQVDIHILPSLESLEWFLFKYAHGDLWNLLGSTIRPFGLTADEVGLYLRIPEIERLDRKKSRILLTQDPTEVLHFLGLASGKEWQEPFATFNDVCEYAASCRFFWLKPEGDDSAGSDDETKAAGGDFRKAKLKANDRKRALARPMFRQWIEEFLPKCREKGRFTECAMTRAATREEAFDRFGVRAEYEDRRWGFLRTRQAQSLYRNVIKATLPDPETMGQERRSHAAAAFKKIVMEDSTEFGVVPPRPLKDENGMFFDDEVRRFVETTWEQVADVAFALHRERKSESGPAVAKKQKVDVGDEKGIDASA